MNFTDREKQLLMENAAVYSRLTLYDEDNSVLQIFNEDDYLIDWDYEDYRYVPDQGFIGQFVARILDGHFMNIPDNISLEDKEIELEIAVKDPELEEQVYHSYGRFIITKIEKEDASGSYKFEASDYTKKFNVAYESSVDYPCLAIDLLNNVAIKAEVDIEGNDICFAYAVGEEGLTAGNYCFSTYVDDTLTYLNFTTESDLSYRDSLMLVVSKGKVIQRVVNEDFSISETEIVYASSTTQVGTLLSSEALRYIDFVNNNFVIDSNQFEEGQSCREVVCAIAKLGYTWARIGTDNKLHLDFVKKVESDVDELDEIDTDKYYEATVTGDTIKPINKVLIGMSNVDGENIYAEQSADRIRLDKMYGETSQDTYTGKNLLNPFVTSQTFNGITSTYDELNQTVTFNGTCTTDNSCFGFTKSGTIALDGTYTLSYEVLGGTISNTKTSTKIQIQQTSNWASISVPLKQTSSSNTQNVSISCTANNIRFDEGVVVSNYKIRVQLEKNSAKTSWERYVGGIPSPNPDYPQNVNTVTGRNVVKIQGKNHFDISLYDGSDKTNSATVSNDGGTLTFTSSNNDAYTPSLWQYANFYEHRKMAMEVNPSTQYTFSFDVDSTPSGKIYIYGADKDYVGIEDVGSITYSDTNRKLTFTTSANTKYLIFRFVLWQAVTINISNIQLEKGGTKTDYEPHVKQEYEIDLGKNLLPPDIQTTTAAGVTVTNNGDGTFNIHGTNTYAGENLFRCFISISDMGLINGETYTYSCSKPLPSGLTSRIEVYNGTTWVRAFTTVIDSNSRSKTAILNSTNANNIRFAIVVSNGATVDIDNIGFQLERCSVATDYAPYYTVSKNLFNKNDIVAGYLSNAGNVISNPNFSTSNFINAEGVSKITISGSSGSSENVCFYTNTKTFISYVTTGTNTTMTIDVPNNTYYLRATIKNTNLNEYQIEKGSTTSTYEPHDKHIELCKIGDYQDYITKNTGANIFIPTLTNNNTNVYKSGCNIDLNGDEYVFTATATDMIFGTVTSVGASYENRFGTLYPTNGASKIYFNCTNPLINKNYVTWFDENKTSLGYEGGAGNNNKVFNVPSNAKYFIVRFGYGSATSGTVYKTRVMVSYTPITDYEPHGENEWYEYHGVGKVVDDGTGWDVSGAGVHTGQKAYHSVKSYGFINTTSGYMNTFNLITSGWNSTNPDGTAYYTSNNMYVKVSETLAPNITAMKNWLSNNNLITYGVLITPEVKKITYQPLIDQLNAIESNAQTYGGKTYITSRGVEVNPKVDITVTDLEQVETSYTNNTDYEVNGHEYEESELKIYDNPLTYTEELRRIAINGAEKLYGLTYTPMTIDSIGHPWLEGDDFVKLTNLEENDLYTYPFDRKLEYKGYLVTDLSSAANNQVQEKYENPNNVLNRLNHTEISVDKANQRIDLIAEQTSGNTQNITNMQLDINGINQSVQHIEDTEIAGLQSQISTVNQTMNAITNMFQISGGINVIRNSAFLLQDAVWEFTDNGTNPYYTPLGSSYNVALSGTTTSVAEIKLRSVKVKSKSENVTNLILGTKYTFNFYHKQDNNMTTTIKMYSTENNNVKAFDDIVITGQQGFRNYEVSFTPTTYANYTIEIIVTSTASVGYAYIYDMMLNSGDKQSWQPASDEIYSTTLQMSRLGLQVYSVGDGTITILGSDGMATHETTDGKTLGRLISLRNIDGDRTRVITTQAVYLTKDITQENDNKWVETIVTISGSPYKVEYVESGE